MVLGAKVKHQVRKGKKNHESITQYLKEDNVLFDNDEAINDMGDEQQIPVQHKSVICNSDSKVESLPYLPPDQRWIQIVDQLQKL